MKNQIYQRITALLTVALILVIFNKIVLSRWSLPNVELIIPVLVIFGCYSNCWKFSMLTILSVAVLDILLWGFHPIYLFTWSGFAFCWYFWGRNAFDPFSSTRRILKRASISVLASILFFDLYTAIGCWLLWYPKTLSGLVATYVAQVPFTLYHLLSLGFVPPLVLLGKKISRVPIAVPVAVRVGTCRRVSR